MRFIRGMRIKDFRSLPKVELDGLDNVVPIVGPNGSGKSNLLRALNFFFNGQLESGVFLELARDFHDPDKKRRDKKQIDVELDLSFGAGLRAELQAPIDRLADGSDTITIRKSYSLDKITREPTTTIQAGKRDGLRSLSQDDRTLIDRLLSSVRFRYISNHIHPTDLLEQEEDNIRRVLLRRLGKSPSFSGDQIERIREAAASLMKPVADELRVSTGRISTVELGTPQDWGELIWAFGLGLQTGSSTVREAVLHGSGIQSVLAYSILHMVDTSLGSGFGWQRGAIWAVEEPESFLHADLQAQLAESLSRYSNSDRLQIFLTTHNTAFLGVAEGGIAVGMSGTASEVQLTPREELIDLALSTGTSPYAHPLHVGTIKPLLLVEGQHDRGLVLRAYAASGTPCPFDVKALIDLEPTLTGGVDQIKTYLSANRTALRARPISSPVVVLVDWDVNEGKRASLESVLADHATSKCRTLPRSARTRGLKGDIPGIEAYLSLAFYEAAERNIGLQLIRPSNASTAGWLLGVEKAELGTRKADLHALLDERADDADIGALVSLVPWMTRLMGPDEGLPLAA